MKKNLIVIILILESVIIVVLAALFMNANSKKCQNKEQNNDNIKCEEKYVSQIKYECIYKDDTTDVSNVKTVSKYNIVADVKGIVLKSEKVTTFQYVSKEAYDIGKTTFVEGDMGKMSYDEENFKITSLIDIYDFDRDQKTEGIIFYYTTEQDLIDSNYECHVVE